VEEDPTRVFQEVDSMLLLSIGLLLALVTSIFAIQNSVVVPVRFFGWQSEASLVVIILASAFLGAAIVGCVAFFRQVRSSVRDLGLKSRLGRLEVELKKFQEKEAKAQSQAKPATEALKVKGPGA